VQLKFYEKRSWFAQIKKNGTNIVLAVSPDKEIKVWRRDGTASKEWQPSNNSARLFKSLPGKCWYVFNTELLNQFGIYDTNYIFDVLVNKGEYLVGKTYAQRYKLLQDLFLHNPIASNQSHYTLDNHTWLARNIRKDFQGIFDSITKIEDEGLVLKNPNGILTMNSDSSWMRKCRKEHKNYSF
jgi:hypothetical protein